MLKVEITGLDKLTRQLDELQRAFASLDGEIATVKFNPHDPRDVDRAIREVERAVDSKASSYQRNPTVRNIVENVKRNFRERLLRRAEEARRSRRHNSLGGRLQSWALPQFCS